MVYFFGVGVIVLSREYCCDIRQNRKFAKIAKQKQGNSSLPHIGTELVPG